MLVGGSKGVPELIFFFISKDYFNFGLKNKFLIKAKKIFVLGVPKVPWEGAKLNNFFFIGGKIWVKSQIFRCGLPEDFFRKGQKANGLRLTVCLFPYFMASLLPYRVVYSATFCSQKSVISKGCVKNYNISVQIYTVRDKRKK